VRDTATRQPMATDLSMRIGSNSKTFTVTSILMLAEQGKLGLDEAITAMDALADSTVRQRLTDLGQEIPSPEQQTAEALAAHQKAEIEK
jgi:CubicO group peptidase (beta-lactamase class C family)